MKHKADRTVHAASNPIGEDLHRKPILARRSKFVTLTLAGLGAGLAAAAIGCQPKPCLKLAGPNDEPAPPTTNTDSTATSAPDVDPAPDETSENTD